jgi:hypothetical protein
MAEYIRPTAVNTKYSRTSQQVIDLAKPYGGTQGQEGALLNGLLAMGYDPAIIRSLADADPNRRFLDDAVTRALRAGIPEDAIRRALESTRAAATGDSQRALEVLNVDPANLPPASRTVYDSIANRQPLPFLDRGQTAPTPTSTGDFRDQRSGAPAPAPAPPPARPTQPLEQPKPGKAGGALGGTLAGTTTQGQQTPGIKALPSLAPNASDAEVEKYIRKWYGYSAWILDVPELRGKMLELGREFAGSDVDEARIEGALTGTEWWKTHESDQRLAIEEKMSDPATYNAKVEGKYRELATLTGTAGFSIPEGRLREIAITAYDAGWDRNEMNSALSAEFDYDPTTGAQDTSALVGDLRQLASDYLVPLSEQTIDQWGKQIIAGTATNEGFTDYAKGVAKQMFGHYAADIDAGRTVKQLADPFVQVAARDLELTADQIDLMDPKWRKALELDPETGQPMQLSKWQRTIRSDSSYGWDTTQNARGEAAEFAKKIAEAFGR